MGKPSKLISSPNSATDRATGASVIGHYIAPRVFWETPDGGGGGSIRSRTVAVVVAELLICGGDEEPFRGGGAVAISGQLYCGDA